MKVQDTLITVEEFEKLYINRPYELLEGKVLKVSPTALSHGDVANLIGYYLRHFLITHGIGGTVVAAETGFKLSEITLRAPDAAYVSAAKLAQVKNREKFLPFAPDLAVEVVSPGDRKSTVQKKIDLYKQANVPLIWIVYTSKPRVVVYAANTEPRTVSLKETLDGGEVLPGLQLKIADLFPHTSKQDS